MQSQKTMTSPDSSQAGSTVEMALLHLREVVLDGLRHGFFDYAITCELVKGSKRRLTIKAGKSYQFTILEEDLRQ